VVQDSFSTSNDVLTFKIYDPEGDPATQLEVRYDGAASSTFGNDVTAICTGKINDAGVLECSELVTKCPSKYENADSALTVEQLLGYGESVYGNVVKVAGSVGAGSLKAAGQGDRFILVDAETGDSMPVVFEGALSDGIADGSAVVPRAPSAPTASSPPPMSHWRASPCR
ncbi:MAG: cytochrome c maturation protein CcmE, partial [Adlercreutzia equolifaciens]